MKRLFLFSVLLFAGMTLGACELLPSAEESGDTAAIPDNAKVFEIEAKRFEFVPDVVTVKKGDTVILKVKSSDVAHGISLPEFNASATLPPGKEVEITFVADKIGEFPFACSVQCGHGHSKMRGKLVVEE